MIKIVDKVYKLGIYCLVNTIIQFNDKQHCMVEHCSWLEIITALIHENIESNILADTFQLLF